MWPLFNTKGSGEWGVGSGGKSSPYLIPHPPLPNFPLPIPHSPLPISHFPTSHSRFPTPHSPFPTPQPPHSPSLRSGHDPLPEDQRAALICPHLASRRACNLVRFSPTHLHLFLSHSRVNLSLLNRPPYLRAPFVFLPGVLVHQVLFKSAQVSGFFMDVGSAQIQINETALAVRRFELEADGLLFIP